MTASPCLCFPLFLSAYSVFSGFTLLSHTSSCVLRFPNESPASPCIYLLRCASLCFLVLLNPAFSCFPLLPLLPPDSHCFLLHPDATYCFPLVLDLPIKALIISQINISVLLWRLDIFRHLTSGSNLEPHNASANRVTLILLIGLAD